MIKRQIVGLNFLILAGIFGLTWGVTSAWKIFEKNHNFNDPDSTLLRRIASSLEDQAEEEPKFQVQPVENPQSIADFMVIPEKNLFAEDRQPGLLETSESDGEEQPPVWSARPILRGVSQSGGRRQGLLTVFEAKPGQGQMRRVRLGDLVQGYAVSEITNSLVKLEWRDRVEIIDMKDVPPQAATVLAGASASAVTVITVGAPPPKAGETVVSTRTLQGQLQPRVQVGVVQGVQSSRGGQGGRGLGSGGQGVQSPFGARIQGNLGDRQAGNSREDLQNKANIGGQRFSRR